MSANGNSNGSFDDNLLHAILASQQAAAAAAGRPAGSPGAAAAVVAQPQVAAAGGAQPPVVVVVTPKPAVAGGSVAGAAAGGPAPAVAAPSSASQPPAGAAKPAPAAGTGGGGAAARVDTKVDAKPGGAGAAAAAAGAAAGPPKMVKMESETAHYAVDPKSGLKIDPKTGKKLDPKIVLKSKPPVLSGTHIYWEKQQSALCARHAVNNLLQGPYITEWDMSAAAVKLQDEERKIMAESGVDSKDFLRFMAGDSQHVDDSGNFSIEVIKRVLEERGMQCHSITSDHGKAGGADPLTETAFICNLNSHWLAVRKLGPAPGHWFNLNSMNKAGPLLISEFYLSAYMQQLKDGGYSIFVVRGDVHAKPNPDAQMPNTYHSLQEALDRKGKDFVTKPKSREQIELERVMRESRAAAEPHRGAGAHGADGGGGGGGATAGGGASDIEAAIRASLQDARNGGGRKPPSDEESDMAKAIRMSMAQSESDADRVQRLAMEEQELLLAEGRARIAARNAAGGAGPAPTAGQPPAHRQ